jgi:hypothetical protein
MRNRWFAATKCERIVVEKYRNGCDGDSPLVPGDGRGLQSADCRLIAACNFVIWGVIQWQGGGCEREYGKPRRWTKLF